jgi:hypothetical protein
VQTTGAGLAVVGVERRIAIWLAIYAIALFGFVFFVIGDLPFAAFLIFTAEYVFLVLRPQPKFGSSTYRPPAPARWQPPITLLRWAGIAHSAWAIATAAVMLVVATLIVLAVLAFLMVTRRLDAPGVANYAVLGLFVAWLSTRPLWIGPMRKALKVEATRMLARYTATVYVGAEGLDLDLVPSSRTPRRTYRFSVGFAELDEVRMMDGLTAEGYMFSMEQYDPTLNIRSEWELVRFLTDQNFRPSVLPMFGIGTQLLMRSPTLFYMVGNADQFGPAAVAAWQAWRAAHPAPVTPTA